MSSNMRVGILAISSALAMSSLGAPRARAADAWSATGPLHTLRGDPAVTILADGRVLAAGGWDYSQGGSVSAEIYDPTTEVWTLTGSMHVGRCRTPAVRLQDGRVFVAGGTGQGSDVPLKDAEVYDPGAGQWQLVPAMQFERSEPSAVLLTDGRVLVVGGDYYDTVARPGEIFDPVAGAWSLTSLPAKPRFLQSATLLQDGRVLVAGGYQTSGNPVRAEVYDPTTDTWTLTGPLVAERRSHSATLLPDGRVLVVGGMLTDGSLAANAELYDPSTNQWTPAGALAVARYSHAAIALENGRVLIIGGIKKNPWTHLSSVEVFDPTSGTFSAGPALLQVRYQHRAVKLQNGALLVLGGDVIGCEKLAEALPDNSPPTVTLIAPSPDVGVSGIVTVAADAQDDTGIVRVDFYDGTALIGTAGAPPYAVTWDTSALPAGSHLLMARAFDKVNKSTDSAPVQIMVYDVILPQVAITAPADGAAVSGTVAITAEASDSSGVLDVEFYVDSIQIGSAGAAPYSVEWDASAASPGAHTLTARAFDQVGNYATSSPVTVIVGGQAGASVYDPQLRAPRCAAGGAGCDSGELLVGRGPVGPEPNQPNTIAASCGDGTYGSFHSDESIDRITISTIDGAPLAPGKTVRVAVTVWAWTSSGADKLHLFYAADANAPQWVPLGTYVPQGVGQQVLSTTYVLPEGPLQAVRARFAYASTSTDACSSGAYDDHDDLVFSPQGQQGSQAAYDANLGAPKCSSVSSSCSSGALLVGRGPLGPEPNAPNTTHGECLDGQEGTFHSEESIDKIQVSSLGGAPMAAGQTVRVDVTVWVGSASDQLDLFYSSAATWPSWSHIARLTPADLGEQVLATTYTLPDDQEHVLRAVLRFGAPSLGFETCGLGAKDDSDDLWFAANAETGKQRLRVDLVSHEGGSGTVTITSGGATYSCSDPAGCDVDVWSGDTAVLTATPATDSAFAGWGGECSGTAPCSVRMDQARSVSASFLGPRSLTVKLSTIDGGSGSVTVTPSPLGGSAAACAHPGGPELVECIYLYPPDTTVTLSSQTPAGSVFAGWGAACSGSGPCQVQLGSGAATVEAAFTGSSLLTITLTSDGGWGVVTASPLSLDGVGSCVLTAGAARQTCSLRYLPGTVVSLTAQPASGSAFAQWGGACSGSGPCQMALTMPASAASALFTVGVPATQAAYDAQLKVPSCNPGATACDSGTLLVGRATRGPEPHYPNTIGASCSDGAYGTFHSDESLDRIKVSTIDGSPLAPGKTVKVEVTVWAWVGYSSDKLDLYAAGDANAPQWTLIGTLTPTKAGEQVLTTTYVLPTGQRQALRGRFRYGGSATSACVSGPYNDHDDLVF